MLRQLLIASALALVIPGCGTALEAESGDPQLRHATDTLPGSFAPGDLLQLVSGYNSKCLETNRDGTANGTQVGTVPCGSRFNQQFWAQLQPSGNYALLSASSGKCLTVASDSGDNGADIILYDCIYPAANEQWHLVELEAGVYQVRAASSGKCLEQPTGSGLLRQWDCRNTSQQRWRIRLAPFSELRVSTGSGGAPKCVTVTGTDVGTPLEQWDCTGGRNQQFWLGQLADGTYELRARHTNQCISLDGWGVDNGTRARQWTCVNQTNQRFRLSPASGVGNYRLQASYVAKCLDRSGVPNSANGAAIQLWACNGGSNQTFAIQGL